MQRPYLLFLGDIHDQLAAKTADGIAYWRPDWCVGQLRLPGCNADTGLPDVTVAEAAAKGAKTLIVAVANSGGVMPDHWSAVLVEAMEHGMDVASGLHTRLGTIPAVAEAASKHGAALHDVRYTDQTFKTGTGAKRAGKRLLTVGTDCSVGKKYSALAITREMEARGMDASFCATGQTGIMIAERGVAIDAVIADFISGSVEWLSPEADPNHWDVIEGQGSLFHAAFSGVTVGLVHGAQPDALVLCHEPTRTHMRGLKHALIPSLDRCIGSYTALASLTNPNARFVGICIDTHLLSDAATDRYLKQNEDKFGLPCVDPLKGGAGQIVDRLANL